MKRIDKLVYVAGPYSHEYERIRQERNDMLTQVSAMLVEKGILNYSPITHSHAQQQYLSNNETSFEYWRRNDFAFLSRCDELYVITLDGWDKSFGVAEEIKFAKEHKIPIRYFKYKNGSLEEIK